jgi:hypothetical protein
VQTVAFAATTPEDTGRATSLFSTQFQVASAVGVALFGAILFTGIRDRTAAAVAGSGTAEAIREAQLAAYHRAFLWVVLFAFAGAVIAALFVRDADAASTMGPT